MFWRFGGYANVSTIDTLLDKPEVTLEELLDESDLIQELKQHNTKLIEYLREDKILERLLEYVVAPKLEAVATEDPEATESQGNDTESKGKERSLSKSRNLSDPDDDEKEKKRNRYAYVAAEVLSSDNWSICESLMENQPLLRKFWDFLKLPPPLDPLQASYFTKVNEALLDKKTEEMLDLFKSLDGAVKNMLQHVDSPMVMDLLLKIISLEKAEGGQGIVDWLHSQDLMPILLSFLSSEHSWATQTSAGDFLKAIITISANASQNEQSCIGPNELTRQLVSQQCIEKLISDMLKGGNPLTVGVGIVIEVIRKNNSDYDPEVGAEANSVPSSRDPIYLGTLLRMFAQRVPDFMELILSPNHTIGGGDGPVTIRRKELNAAFGGKIEPLGFDRFKTCELMAELLHCSNMGLLNEIGSEEFVKARDAERERLKSEGKLGISAHQSAVSMEELTMKSSTTRLGSPDGLRKLEVQNASDDDGFEEVTHAADLGDDAKDDFDEKPEPGEDILTPTNATSPLSFMDKDDEEFVDEPLTSPRLKSAELNLSHQFQDPEMAVAPLSPTKVPTQLEKLSQQVESLTTVPLPEKSSETLPVAEEKPSVHEIAENPISLDPLAHPEDKPAPLFAKKAEPTEESTSIEVDPTDQSPERVDPLSISNGREESQMENLPSADSEHPSEVPPPVPEVSSGGESLDTTKGEAGDSSIIIGTDEPNQDSTLEEVPTTPVVGDFLKMQFVEHKVVPTILDFFFRFPWNNFLHNVVYDVVQQVFNGPMDRGFNRSLAIDLFETGDITMRIVDGQKKSDEAQAKNKMRLGYMGHLTLIAEEVVKFTERHPPELLSESVLEKVMNGEWITYVEVTLAETRERDNAILGGVRPDMSVGPRQAVMNAVNAANNFGGGSSVLAEAGLNGSAGLDSIDLANGNHTSSFTLSGGTLLSGFGSSSDEEDDDIDEENEDEGARNNHSAAEFSRYISTPSTTTATSSDLEPPSAPPPPPPPLNIPPSRARRQLAARLALHSKQNSEAHPENGDRADQAEHRKNLNPFATEEDDDSDNEDNDREFSIGDLEVEGEESGLLGMEEKGSKNVGVPSNASVLSSSNTLGIGGGTRASFPSMWPFGSNNSHSHSHSTKDFAVSHDMEELEESNSHFRGSNANDHDEQSSDDSDSDDGYGDRALGGAEFGSDGQSERVGKRRLSVTTEAKRRTSLEDDDEDEEVVHVAMAEAEAEAGKEDEGKEEDGELVEIQHDETQGVEAAKE